MVTLRKKEFFCDTLLLLVVEIGIEKVSGRLIRTKYCEKLCPVPVTNVVS